MHIYNLLRKDAAEDEKDSPEIATTLLLGMISG